MALAFQEISEAEMQVMRVLWEHDKPMTSAEVIQRLAATSHWKPSTIWTFLGRLVDKGLLLAEKQGKRSLYTPLASEADYRQAQTRQFLANVHGGSVKSFFAALSGGEELAPEDLEELKRWLETESGGDA